MMPDVSTGDGRKTVDLRELPLSIGGAGAALTIIGLQRGQAAANVGAVSQGSYVTPGEPAAHLNGQPLTERSRLTHGDVLSAGDGLVFFVMQGARPQLLVETAHQERTAPPVIERDEPTEFEDDAQAQPIKRASFRP